MILCFLLLLFFQMPGGGAVRVRGVRLWGGTEPPPTFSTPSATTATPTAAVAAAAGAAVGGGGSPRIVDVLDGKEDTHATLPVARTVSEDGTPMFSLFDDDDAGQGT